METKFTKGEWVVRPSAMGGVMEKDSERTIANCMCYSSNINQELIYQENIANAKLIAAAPKMYKALEEILNGCPPATAEEAFMFVDIAKSIAKEALQKATE